MNFKQLVYHYYRLHKRDLPWRHNTTLYRVLVSEFMLQQTQVARVLDYFPRFIQRFPTASGLAAAPLSSVLRLWQGLGYNRRAKYLWETARQIAKNEEKKYTKGELRALPGIGDCTAGAVCVYVYNTPEVFIETNIRTVFMHHFFPDAPTVSDRDIEPLIEKTLDTKHPREWYWALMDYGSYLKKQGVTNRTSAHYHTQSPFKGSMRQLRGHVLAYVLQHRSYTTRQLQRALSCAPTELVNVLAQLQKEGLLPIIR